MSAPATSRDKLGNLDGEQMDRNQEIQRLFELYGDRLRRIVNVHLPSVAQGRFTADDVLQEVIIGTMKSGAALPATEQHEFPWLYRVTRRRMSALLRAFSAKCRDVRRELRLSDQSATKIFQDAHQVSPSGELMAKEHAQIVHAIMDDLPESQREILTMRVAEGLSFPEISLILDITPGAATQRFFRALKAIQERGRRVLPNTSYLNEK